MATFVHVVNLPLLFTSSTLVPLKQMPDWLATASRANPLSLAVEPCRQALLFGEFGSLPRNTVLLALIAVLLFSMACFAAGSSRRQI